MNTQCKPLLNLALSALLLAVAGTAVSAPNSISDKGAVSQKSSVTAKNRNSINAEQVKINGLKGGKIINSGNKIIVQGGTIVSKNGDKEPAIRIENPHNKQILIQNTRILSDGVTQDNKNGSAGIVVIENNKKQTGNSSSRVKIDNVRVEARNSTIRAQSSDGSSACAGVVCTGFGDDDDSDMVVHIHGKNTFEAIAK